MVSHHLMQLSVIARTLNYFFEICIFSLYSWCFKHVNLFFGPQVYNRRKEGHLLAPGITVNWYQDRERELRQYFTIQDKLSLVYCNNIVGLIRSICLEYNVTEWRLFIDLPSRSLKAVPHNGTFFIYPYWAFSTNKRNSQQHGSFAVCC